MPRAVASDARRSASIRSWPRRRRATRSRTSALEYRDVLRRVGPVRGLRPSHRAEHRRRGAAAHATSAPAARSGVLRVPRVDRRADGRGVPAIAARADRARVPQHHAGEVLRRPRRRRSPSCSCSAATSSSSIRHAGRARDRRLALQRRRARGHRLRGRARDPAGRRTRSGWSAPRPDAGMLEVPRPVDPRSAAAVRRPARFRTSGPTCS